MTPTVTVVNWQRKNNWINSIIIIACKVFHSEQLSHSVFWWFGYKYTCQMSFLFFFQAFPDIIHLPMLKFLCGGGGGISIAPNIRCPLHSTFLRIPFMGKRHCIPASWNRDSFHHLTMFLVSFQHFKYQWIKLKKMLPLFGCMDHNSDPTTKTNNRLTHFWQQENY